MNKKTVGITLFLCLVLLHLVWAIDPLKEGKLVKRTQERIPISMEPSCTTGCQEPLIFTRELVIYELNESEYETDRYVSFINLTVESKATESLHNVTLKEKIPSKVTTNATKLGYIQKPIRFERKDTVAVWSFDKIDPNERKVIGYSIKKKLSKDILKEYTEPEIEIKPVYAPPKKEKEKFSPIWLLSSLALVSLIIINYIFFARPKFKEK